jgi:hypothetical protein
MKYVLYHSSITGDRSAMQKLKEHAENGKVVAEFFDDLSRSDTTPELNKALQKSRETGAMLLILDLSVVDNLEASEKEGIQIKRIT